MESTLGWFQLALHSHCSVVCLRLDTDCEHGADLHRTRVTTTPGKYRRAEWKSDPPARRDRGLFWFPGFLFLVTEKPRADLNGLIKLSIFPLVIYYVTTLGIPIGEWQFPSSRILGALAVCFGDSVAGNASCACVAGADELANGRVLQRAAARDSA